MKTVLCVLFLSIGSVIAQDIFPGSWTQSRRQHAIRLSGPRTGITVITGDVAEKLDRELNASPVITQFGWQFEKCVMSNGDNVAFLSEFVPLVGGLDQGLFLPSLSWIFGVRGSQGKEIGFGANLSVAGGAYVVAAGVTKRIGNLNFPINGSVVLSKGGPRLSLLIGINMMD